VDHAIRQAVHELIAEVGYAGLTMDAVAARAGIGKAAIYRRHASRVEMVFTSLVHGFVPEPLADTGSLLGDLTALADKVVAAFSSPAMTAAAPGLLAEMDQYPEVAERFQQTFVAAELVEVKGILRRARARGEQTMDLQPELIHAAMLGTVFGWMFLLRQPPGPDLAQRVAALVASALTAVT
jgi:AcrR family transcriptional regulator